MDGMHDIAEFETSLEGAHLLSRQTINNLGDVQDAAGVSNADRQDVQDTAGVSNADLTRLSRNGNMSSRAYDKYVYSLGKQRTGCERQGALPVPLAANDTCLPGWNCELPDTREAAGVGDGADEVQASRATSTTHRSTAPRPKPARSSAPAARPVHPRVASSPRSAM